MAKVPIITTYDDTGLKRAQKDLNRAKRDLAGVGRAATNAVKGMAVMAGAAVALGGKLVLMAEEEATANARLDNITKSMGLFGDEAGNVSKRLQELATKQAAMTGVDDGVIKLTQAKLMTFKELAASADDAGGAFDRATVAAIDMAAAGFGTAESNAVQLGKALNDPIAGITALNRSGITFTAQQKEQIKTLVESGKTLEAQDMILKAIETQVGGTAEATANASDKMKWAVGEVGENIGAFLLPAFERLQVFVTDKVLPAVTAFSDKVSAGADPVQALSDLVGDVFGPKVQEVFESAVAVVTKLYDAFTKAVDFVVKNKDWLLPIAAGIAALSVAYKGLTIVMNAWKTVTLLAKAAQLALNLALSLNPIGIVIALVAGLVAVIVYLWETNEGFRDAVKGIWTSIARGISDAIKGVKLAIYESLIKPLNAVIDVFNKIFKTSIRPIKWSVSGVTGNESTARNYSGIGSPQLGQFAEGGIATGPTSGYLAMLHGREAVLPLDDPRRARQVASEAGIGGITIAPGAIVINASGSAASPQSIAAAVRDELKNIVRSGYALARG